MNIKLRVRNLINRCNSKNPFKICKILNIKIIYKDIGKIKGYYTTCLRKKIIVLNENLDVLSMKIVLAHELGHAILHKKEINLMKETFMFPKNSKVEKEANQFAAELLIDEFLTDEYINFSSSELEIFEELCKLKG